MSSAAARDHRIDVIRGLALWIICSDHIPANTLAAWTPRAWGFSDMAEVFVFLSGYVCGLVYRRSLGKAGLWGCQRKAARRVVQIYAAAVATSCLTSGLLAWSRGTAWNAGDVLISSLLLRDLGGNLAILPLYGFLLLALPAWLWLYLRRPATALAVSLGAYGLVQLTPVPAGNPGGWLAYHPLAWQLLFFAAAVCSQSPERWRRGVSEWWVIGLALAVVQGSLLAKVAWPEVAVPLIGKPRLEPLRLLHFAALAILFANVAPSNTACQAAWLWPLRVCGRNSLPAFCAGDVAAQWWSSFLAPQAPWARQAGANLSVWTASLGGAMLGAWYKRRLGKNQTARPRGRERPE